MALEMDMGSWFTGKIGFMKDSGPMIRGREREWKDILMEISMKAIFIRERHMEKEFIIGLTEKFMTESGRMESKRATGCGRAYLEIPISVSGKTQRLMDMEFTSGKMEIGTRVPG